MDKETAKANLIQLLEQLVSQCEQVAERREKLAQSGRVMDSQQLMELAKADRRHAELYREQIAILRSLD